MVAKTKFTKQLKIGETPVFKWRRQPLYFCFYQYLGKNLGQYFSWHFPQITCQGYTLNKAIILFRLTHNLGQNMILFCYFIYFSYLFDI
jgi:hypothetical protein